MTVCGMCNARFAERGHQIAFAGVERTERRPPVRVDMSVPLCKVCATVAFKHLKRIIPKRKFEITPVQ